MTPMTIQNDNLVDSILTAAQPLVLFSTCGMIMAAPLAQAYRFDEIDYSADAKTASYHGSEMTVHSISKLLSGRKPVIVFGSETTHEGLVVDEILDIVAFSGLLAPTSEASAGAAMIRGRVTEIVNLEWFASQSAKKAA